VRTNMENRSPSLGWFLLCALGIHALFLQAEWLNKIMGGSTKAALSRLWETPILVEPWTGKEKRPVVQSSEALEQFKSEKEADKVGEFRNRVREETQASRRGKFLEGSEGKASPELGLEGEAGPPKNLGRGMSDLLPGASPNILKGVRQGNQTVLNTDKVLYASFINRIADEIYDVWVRYCEEGVKDIYRRGAKLEANVFVTKLNVVMNPRGELSSLQILQSSGISELDEAPKKAFWESEPFPNPPKQLMEADGFIRLTYEFQFEWRTSSFNIVPQGI
jgi:TonB family protein